MTSRENINISFRDEYSSPRKAISIVIPLFNEQDSVEHLYAKLKYELDRIGREYEVIFVNDGSTDSTLERLRYFAAIDNYIKVISFNNNKGQGRALLEGIRNACGEVIITMDGDLQCDPSDIPLLLGELGKGYDIVCGWRFIRSDTAIKIYKSKVANLIQRIVTGMDIHDMSCTFRAYREEILRGISVKGKYDFCMLPYIISRKYPVKVSEFKIQHKKRGYGKSKYSLLDTVFGTTIDFLRILFTN